MTEAEIAKQRELVSRQDLEDEVTWLSQRLYDKGWGSTKIRYLHPTVQSDTNPPNSIDRLIFKAASADHSQDALKYSQAALNVANALATKQQTEEAK